MLGAGFSGGGGGGGAPGGGGFNPKELRSQIAEYGFGI